MSAADDLLDETLRVFATTLGPEERALLQRVVGRMNEVVETLTEQARSPSTEAARDRGIAQAQEVMAAAIADLEGPIAAGQSVMADQIHEGFANAIDGVASSSLRRLSVDQLAAAADGPFFGWGTKDWTRWHDQTAAAQLDRELRAAFFAGDSVDAVVSRMAKVTGSTRQSMMVTARTALVSAGNASARQLYLNNSDVVPQVMIVGTLDSAICRQCLGFDGTKVDPSQAALLPPFHPQCRCFTAPMVKGFPEPKRVNAAWWIGRQSAQTQNQVLGKGVADLYRAGRIKPEQFSTNTGRMRTLAELRDIAASPAN